MPNSIDAPWRNPDETIFWAMGIGMILGVFILILLFSIIFIISEVI